MYTNIHTYKYIYVPINMHNLYYSVDKHIPYTCTYIDIHNTFTPQINGSCCGHVMYHIPQFSRCVTTSRVLQLPIGMHIIMLQLPMVCCNNTRISQNVLMQLVKLPFFIKAHHIDVNCGFKFRCY